MITAVCSDFMSADLPEDVPLIIADPPYGGIVDESWDTVTSDDLICWTKRLATCLSKGGALYMWGGIGKPGNRPFYEFASRVERETPLSIANHITWSKKRAYGVQHNYLFTREELLYLCNGDVKKPRKFHVPLLEQKRGYSGYDEKHPAKSEFLRRTNVWMDVTEIFRGKVHPTQKPQRLHEIIIETHTDPGELVLDPFGGSGTTAMAAKKLGRDCVIIEKNPDIFRNMVDRISGS